VRGRGFKSEAVGSKKNLQVTAGGRKKIRRNLGTTEDGKERGRSKAAKDQETCDHPQRNVSRNPFGAKGGEGDRMKPTR